MIMAIDIGSYKVSCAIGTVGADGFVFIETAYMVKSKGFDNGMVINVDMAVQTIRHLMQNIRRQYAKKITQVWCSVSGLKITSVWTKSQTDIDSGYVLTHDINRVISQCMDSLNMDSLDFLHVLPHTYEVDTVVTKTPLKMAGKQLLAHVLVCRGDKTVIDNIHSVFEDCNVKIGCVAIDGYMSALAVLDTQELDLEYAMCIDMGDSTISVSLFYRGALVWCKNFAFGVGDVITHIMNKTAMNRQSADGFIKRATVSVDDVPYSDANRPLTYDRICEQDESYYVSLGDIGKMVRDKYTQAFKMIKDTIPAHFGPIHRIVLTGGASDTQGIRDLASTVMQAHVRIGRPHKVKMKNENKRLMISPAVIGLIKYSQHHLSTDNQSYIRNHSRQYTGNVFCRLYQWFKDNI